MTRLDPKHSKTTEREKKNALNRKRPKKINPCMHVHEHRQTDRQTDCQMETETDRDRGTYMSFKPNDAYTKLSIFLE